jgi:secreted trypsin-like serine protease
VPIVTDSGAEQAYDPRLVTRLTRQSKYSPPVEITAGGKGKDTCQGDSGGALFFALGPDGGGDNDDGDNGGFSGKYTQIGITSFGCGVRVQRLLRSVHRGEQPLHQELIKSAASK